MMGWQSHLTGLKSCELSVERGELGVHQWGSQRAENAINGKLLSRAEHHELATCSRLPQGAAGVVRCPEHPAIPHLRNKCCVPGYAGTMAKRQAPVTASPQ
jgi:hypothetical protein